MKLGDAPRPPKSPLNQRFTQWGGNNWCRGGLSLSLTATEAQGRDVLISGDVAGTVFACPTGAGTASCSLPLPEGTGTVNYSATSSIGRSASGSITYQQDSLQPQIDGWLNGTPGNNPWFISPVDVNASASDPAPGSGLSAFEYSLDGMGWDNFPGMLSVSDGVHSLGLRATDVAGNVVETSQTIQVDTITPTLDLSLTGTAGKNGWYISTVELHAAAADGGSPLSGTSGLAALEASVNGGEWNAFTAPLVFNDGGHSFQFRALDHAGNLIETPLQRLNVDTILPVIDLPASWTLGQIAAFKLQDDGSGLAGLRLVIEDEDERYPKVAWDEGLSGNKFQDEIAWDGRFKDGSQALPGGEYHAWLKVTDNAGNESMQAGQIIVDAVVPSSISTPSKTVSVPEAPASVESESKVPNSTLSLPASVSPVTSFGGGGNGLQPSAAQVGKKSFTVGPTTTSQAPDFQSSVLWGASATAAIGAFAAEIARRKQEEEEARAAQRAANAEINQARKRIAAAYRASLNNFNAAVEKARAFGMSETEADKLKTDVVKSGKIGASLGAAQEYVVHKVKEIQELKEAERITRKEELLDPKVPPKPAYTVPDMSWKERDYAQLEHAQEVAEANKSMDDKSVWEKAIDWIDGHQVVASIGIGVAIGLGTAAIILTGGAAAPVIIGAIALSGVITVGGTIALNTHYGRDWHENIIKNTVISIFTTVLTAGIAVVGAKVLGAGITFCTMNPTCSSIIDRAMKVVDFIEETSLVVKAGMQTFYGDSNGASETLAELELEHLDGGMPGNTIAKELGEEMSGWTTKYGDDVVDFVKVYGDDAIVLIRRYQSDAIEIIRDYGDKGIDLLVKYGDNAISLIKKYGDDGIDILERHGDEILEVSENGILIITGENAERIVRELSEITDNEVFYSVTSGALNLPQSTREGINAAQKYVKIGKRGDGSEELLQIIVDNSTRGSGNRLVLGKWDKMEDGGGYVKEALDNGGIFLDTGSEISKLLDENGIEFWVINEKFLENQLESGVERIDFVSGDIWDVLAKDPKSYRAKEIQWLLENAPKKGYELVGNSWIKIIP